MRKAITLVCLLLVSFSGVSQTNDTLSTEKATVYFVRAKALGALINFTYFDGDKVIGKFNGPKYMKYECAPGKHLFWARSENKSFVEAELKAGEIYLIEVQPKMGGLKASVKLVPVNKNDYDLKKIQKLVSKKEAETFTQEELAALQTEMSDIIAKGMEKYSESKEKEKDIAVLTSDMTITLDDLVYEKK